MKRKLRNWNGIHSFQLAITASFQSRFTLLSICPALPCAQHSGNPQDRAAFASVEPSVPHNNHREQCGAPDAVQSIVLTNLLLS